MVSTQALWSDTATCFAATGGTPPPVVLDEALLDEALLDEALLDAALLDAALLDAALLDEALLDAALLDEALLDEALLDEALLDEAASEDAPPEPPGGASTDTAPRSTGEWECVLAFEAVPPTPEPPGPDQSPSGRHADNAAASTSGAP